jgi:glycosyltransferase involved in cell wall biosynthesis
VKFSVVIATYNRARELGETLASLAVIQCADHWEVIVVDNNSTDDTRAVVETARTDFPVSLVYVNERHQGRSAALNAGFSVTSGDIIVTTDDDVRVPSDWLVRIGEAFDATAGDYVGGRVLPLWSAPPPRWLPDRGGPLWAAIALLDYGSDVIAFGKRVPLGVNMAFRRAAIDVVGGLNPRIGRKAGTLLGQEVREWCLRARAAGLRGCYVPSVVVRHVIPRERVTKRYYRRWFYWRGISRAMLYAETRLDMEAPEQSTLDFDRVPHVLGVPRYMFRSALRAAKNAVLGKFRRDAVAAFEHEVWLCFFAGVVSQRLKDRHLVHSAAALHSPPR